MIKTMLRPFMKRFIGLFFSMVFVSMLSIGLLAAFSSGITNLSKSYEKYKVEYGAASAVITTQFMLKEKMPGSEEIRGADKVDKRISINSYLQKPDGRTITSRIFSYNEETDTFFKRYVEESGTKNSDIINVGVTDKFAQNNGFKVGDTIKFGYFNMFVDANISEIVDTPESMYVRASDYIWSDNTDFGFVYVSEQELNSALHRIAGMIKEKIDVDPEYKEYYEKASQVADVVFPDWQEVLDSTNFAGLYGNQILIKAADGYTEQHVLDTALTYLEGKDVTVKSSSVGANQIYQLYMKNSIKQLTVASVFLPVFFYTVTMIVIVLFIDQIIKAMTHDIGIMMSVGIEAKEIVKLFAIYTLFMTIAASICGTGVGIGLTAFMSNVFSKAYALPIMPKTINVLWCVLAGLSLVVVGQIASVISCRKIFKITPKDAMISNESTRKKLPKWLDKFIDKAPMNTKLGVNSIAQNPRRFVVSTFSIFAAFVMILLTCFFYVAKGQLIEQTLDKRMNFDCQVYLTERESDLGNDLKAHSSVKDIVDCYFTYIEVKKGDQAVMLETLALPEDHGDLLFIPSADGKTPTDISEDGIVLTAKTAKILGVSKGDTVSINGHEVEITDISAQYFHLTQYMSKGQMEKLGVQYVSSYLVNIENEEEFLQYLSEKKNNSLTVFTDSLGKDLRGLFSSVDIFIIIMILFALGMGFVILSIMSQNSLMEQRRPISVMRAIGFRVIDVSNLWTLQSVLELILSALSAIPCGVLLSLLLFRMASSSQQVYPFIFDWRVILFATGFILFVIVAAHVLSMLSIKRWNLADNTRSRE